MYKAVIFDLDGTVLDTILGLATSMNIIRGKLGLPEQTVSEIQAMVGNGIRNLVKRSTSRDIEAGIEVDVDAVYEAFMKYYSENCIDNTWPYDGIIEMLTDLKANGVKLGIVSNKADYPSNVLCDHFFPGIFDDVRGNRTGVALKPAPDAVYSCLEVLGVDKEDAVYVGDSEVDIKTAANSGMPCISVSWGFKTRAFLEEKGAETIADSVNELRTLLGL